MNNGGTDSRSVSRSGRWKKSSRSGQHTSIVSCVVIAASLVFFTLHVGAFQGCTASWAVHRSHVSSFKGQWRASTGNVFRMSSDAANTDESVEDILESTPSVVDLPTTKQLLIFIFTTVLVWTSEPLLSIVDSATVGSYANRAIQSGIPSNLASVVSLAALGPATMLCDSAIYLTYFIGLAATNKLARASAKQDWKAMIEVSSHSIGLSIALSVVVLFALVLFGEPLLKSIIGPGGAVFTDIASKKSIDLTSEVVRIGMGYTWIRAIAAGFAITGSTAQSLLLCVLDTPTVTLAVLVATILNTIGDIYLVAYRGMGVQGAAIATSIATIVSNIILISKGRSLVKQWRLALWTEKWGEDRKLPLNHNMKGADTGTKTDEAKEYMVLPFASLPDKDSFRSLLLLAGPIFLVMLARMIEFWHMTTGANNFGLLSTACHNLLMKVFLFFAVFADGISQASQTFLPGLFVKRRNTDSKKKRHKCSKEADKVIRRLSVISVSLGVFISIVASWIVNNAGFVFTPDKQLVRLMTSSSIYMAANLLLNPLAEMLEGVMIAAGESRYLLLTRGMLMTMFLGALRMTVSRFTDIWSTLLLFQVVKILIGFRFCMKRKMQQANI